MRPAWLALFLVIGLAAPAVRAEGVPLIRNKV